MSWLLLAFVACGPDAAVVAQGLGSGNPAVRGDMMDLAKNVQDPLISQGLVGALDDRSADLRVRALVALAEQEDLTVVPAVAEALLDSDLRVQVAAAECLGRLGDPAGAPALLAYVESQKLPPLNAIWALGQIGDASAIPVLAGLRTSRDGHVSWNATQALRELGDAPALGDQVPASLEEQGSVPEEEPPQEPVQELEAPTPQAPSVRTDREAPPENQKVAWPPG
ncbi:MAG: HEAT repeat protein [Cognaticolwellia sp.]|jgi:HEAT repeat protein